MSLTINAKTFTADSFSANAIGYTGPAHTQSWKDYLRLGRVFAKLSALFSGVGRTSAKLTRTHTLTGALTTTGEAILEISTSIPVGTAPADIDALLNDMGAFLSGANYKTLVKNQTVSF